MKKIIIAFIILMILVIPASVLALTVGWDEHPDTNVLGYTLYWQEQGTTEEFRVNISGRINTQYVIENKFLKVGSTYDIWATAYNDQANSDSSNVITAIRDLVFLPPVSNLPTVEYESDKPDKITITATP